MSKNHILYLSYTGLLEPLGRSQILAYLTRMSGDYSFTIVSFEKRDDFSDKDAVHALDAECKKHNIDWQPKIYHKSPRLLATLYDLLILFLTTYKISRTQVDIIHCRSYIPAIVAWLVGKINKKPFLFDMRALWIDEMIEAGRLQKKSILYIVLRKLEERLLKRSASIISLTEAAVPYLLKKYPFLSKNKFTVISTCVDLSKFNVIEAPANKKIVIGTMGTVVSGWYHLDWLAETFKISDAIFDHPKYKIVTKDSCSVIESEFSSVNFDVNKLNIISSKPEDIQFHINELSFAVLYFTSGVSKIGSAPTRMAEFLAAGIPILGNRGVGDMADVIEKYKVGVVIDAGTQESLLDGVIRMKVLLEDPGLSERCRSVAHELFSADNGAASYSKIYRRCIKK